MATKTATAWNGQPIVDATTSAGRAAYKAGGYLTTQNAQPTPTPSSGDFTPTPAMQAGLARNAASDATGANITGGTPTTPTALTNPQVDTGQPSPTTAGVNPPNDSYLPYAQAQSNLIDSGVQGQELTMAEDSLRNAYQKGFTSTQGQQAPQTASEGGTMVKSALSQFPQKYTPTPEIQSDLDKTLSIYTQAVTQFLNPSTQRDSLVSDYDQLSSSLGLPALRAELLDVNRIMNGTEDDIRSEITAAGGFATESQVQAMTIGRNKSLLMKAQFVQDQLTSAKDELNTKINLSAQDRQFAQQRMTQGISMLGNMVQIQQTMHKASQDNFNNIVARQGYDGLYAMTGGDLYNIGLAEQTLGMQPGGLQIASETDAKNRAIETESTGLDLALKRQKLSESGPGQNIYGTIDGKPQNASQSAANSYANRLNESNVVLSSLGDKFTGKFALTPTLNFLKTSDRQAYEQAQKNFITAVLRRESGAAIAESEFVTARDIYFPQAGDKTSTVLQKENARNTVINNFYRESNTNRPVLPGQIIESGGQRYKVGLDGETLEKI